jgi:hypothetical protein
MRPKSLILAVSLMAISSILSVGYAQRKPTPPVPIILDTDMDSDCDDAGALAMLHALADRGDVQILGVMISAGNEWSAPCADAIDTYFGRPDIPVGVPLTPGPIVQESKYAKEIALKWPNDMPEPAKRPKATSLYRKILAEQKEKVTLVSIGDLTNLAQLLDTKADEYSELGGRDLVEQKVKHWVCMGSRYPADLDPAKWGNFKMDPKSTVKAIEGWPTKVTFTGGGKFAESLATGAKLNTLPEENPVRRAYELYFGGKSKDRHSADQIAVFVAVSLDVNHPWKVVRRGYNHVFPDGRHEWRTDKESPLQQYVAELNDDYPADGVAAAMEDLMLHLPQKK